ncbi:hypothetical protein BHE74_00016502 [Ensete ventricosum]|nr:hypothetical protein GW17_00005126 [Ensete ventricosum]RWW75480.1 hypothetical protein BHE74_00016502 [Ensete ventricosum]RZR79105.1 hypothetical protein BHM03_00004721 [Ensete ventricosum]
MRSLSKRRPVEKGRRRLGVSTCGAVSRRRWCPHLPGPTLRAVMAHLDFAYRIRRSPSSSTRRPSPCAVAGYRGCARKSTEVADEGAERGEATVVIAGRAPFVGAAAFRATHLPLY